MFSGHFCSITIFKNYSTPLLLISLLSFLFIFIHKIFNEQMVKFGLINQYPVVSVNENLPNFFKSVKLSSAKELIIENQNMKTNFGFETTDPDTIDSLTCISMPRKAMQGTPWYQLLSNPFYAN